MLGNSFKNYGNLLNGELRIYRFFCSLEALYRLQTKEWCGFKSEQEICFSSYAGTTHTISSGNCPSFSCATSSYRLRWSRGSVLAFSTQVCGFKPGRSRRIFRAKKFLSTPSFGGEVEPSVPCRRFAACKRSLNLRGSRNLDKITTGHLSRPQFHLSLLGSLTSLRTEAPGG